eukprot:TRINITY_DN3414_c0_g1_i1.p1 TRINITY_DN3414_c0_g1~~TRINITY_DN3414_c0_g1_i1.p1  ORF type:complete len:647 (+),score=121.28 TRINITY_DN3414_c0_g1_i1:77-2017(+)
MWWSVLASTFVTALCATPAVTAPRAITTRAQLNAAIATGPNRKMGFLSEANYNSVHTVLSSQVEPVYFADTTELYAAVESGSVIAGLISGQPNATRFSVFSTDLVSPRAFQFMPGDNSRDLVHAVDAAVVRSHNAGDLLKSQLANPPFQLVEVHTCRSDDPSKIPFPAAANATGLLKDVLDNKRLRILSYGAPDDLPNWQQDGNYQVTPATGFWPDYMEAFMGHFRKEYGADIQLERVWMKAGGTDMVLNGSIHMTEPYYIYENLFQDRLKKWSHSFSCVVLGYEQQFFAKPASSTVLTDAEEDGSCQLELNECMQGQLDHRIGSRAKLNSVIATGPNRRMGFLSEANYNSVHTVLSDKVEPVYFADTTELYNAVESGDVVAALISGQPNETRFSVFSTDLISPRSFQMMPGDTSRHLMEAVDAAVVRTHNAAELRTAQENNPPFALVEVHTCRVDDPSKIPFPDAATATGLLKEVLDNKKLRILSYGLPDDKPNWQQDGNYQVTPETGFWPEYMTAFMAHFRTAYGADIQLERIWMKSGGTDMVLNGSIHLTEPYYIYENLHQDRLKKWSHEFSCVVLGYEQQFFAREAQTDFSSAGDSCEDQLAMCQQGSVPISGADRGRRPAAVALLTLLFCSTSWFSGSVRF